MARIYLLLSFTFWGFTVSNLTLIADETERVFTVAGAGRTVFVVSIVNNGSEEPPKVKFTLYIDGEKANTFNAIWNYNLGKQNISLNLYHNNVFNGEVAEMATDGTFSVSGMQYGHINESKIDTILKKAGYKQRAIDEYRSSLLTRLAGSEGACATVTETVNRILQAR